MAGQQATNPHRGRPSARVVVLRTFSLFAILLAMVAVFATMISGAFLYDDGAIRRVGLSDLSLVRFDGLVQNQALGGDNYLVRAHWSVNGFGWEYPSAPRRDLTAGLVFSGAGRRLRLPGHLVEMAQLLGLDASEYACVRTLGAAGPGSSASCTNPFFHKFRAPGQYLTAHGIAAFVFLVLDACLLGYVLACDVYCLVATLRGRAGSTARSKPHDAESRAAHGGGKAVGDAGRLVPGSAWDSSLCVKHLVVAVSLMLTSLTATCHGAVVVGFLRGRGVESAALGGKAMALLWGAVLVLLLSCVALLLSRRIHKNAERVARVARELEAQREEALRAARIEKQLSATRRPPTRGVASGPPPSYPSSRSRSGDKLDDEKKYSDIEL